MSRGLHTFKKADLRRALLTAKEVGVRVERVILPGGAVIEFGGVSIQPLASEPKAGAVASRRGSPARRQAAG